MQLPIPSERPSIRKFARLMNRRSRSGQSIIIVALAFIALIAFVGIATDVALLFVRYSTLSRAVDAAAIAAAGQVREDATYLTLNAVAQQFIQAHGINPSSVKVETCETEQDDLVKAGTVAAGDYVGARDLLIARPGEQLCKNPPQKLVRVSAQLQSDTTFLSLLGWRTVTLVTSAVSQTASLDVALVLDTSLSEAGDTRTSEGISSSGSLVYPCGSGATKYYTSAQCNTAKVYNSDALRDYKYFTNDGPTTAAGESTDPTQVWGLGLSQFPASPVWPSGTASSDKAKGSDAASGPYPYGVTSGKPPIRYECWWTYQDLYTTNANYGWAGCCNDPTTQSDSNKADGTPQQGYLDSSGNYTPYSVTWATGEDYYNADPNKGGNLVGMNPNPDWYLVDPGGSAESAIMVNGTNPFASPPAKAATVLSGLPDGNRSDLVCRPFKDVRDAARRFINNLDFTRGDRVALVTFDSSTSIKKPFGGTVDMLDDKNTAISTLNQQVGVEVNLRKEQNGNCQSVNTPLLGPDKNTSDTPPLDQWTASGAAPTDDNGTYGEYFDVNQPRNLFTYWTVAQCPDTNTGGGILAATQALVNPNWIRRDAVWVMIILSDGYPNRTPSVGNGGILNATHLSASADTNNPGTNDWNSWFQLPVYGTNGESGVFDSGVSGNGPAPTTADIIKYCIPYTDYNASPPDDPANANPYYGTKPEYCSSAAAASQGVNSWGIAQSSFGFCPWWTFCDLLAGKTDDPRTHNYNPGWTPDNMVPTRMPQCTENDPMGIWEATSVANVSNENPINIVPSCVDTDPNSRHFCQDGNGLINPSSANGAKPSDYYCDPHYDADDYARDRADFAGLINYMGKAADKTTGLPTTPGLKGNFIAMYSIFFAHTTAAVADPLGENILGVKFMRYVADVGDNGIIDNHLQRWYRDVRDGVVPIVTSGPTYDWRNPPTGKNEGNVQIYDSAHPKGDVDTILNQTTNKLPLPSNLAGFQPTPPSYDGSASLWQTSPYNYPAEEDPCALYDYSESQNAGDLPGVPADAFSGKVSASTAPEIAYETLAQQDCGQYYYANSPTKVNKAFTDIASRLFTRLSR